MEETKNVQREYISTQAVTYFIISVLAAVAAGKTTEGYQELVNKPWFYIDRTGPVPLPIINIHFNFAYWLILGISLILLALSIYFLISFFIRKWVPKAASLAASFSPMISGLVLLAFVLSWISGINMLMAEIDNAVVASIFVYAGFIIFIGLFAHLIFGMSKFGKNSKELDKKNKL